MEKQICLSEFMKYLLFLLSLVSLTAETLTWIPSTDVVSSYRFTFKTNGITSTTVTLPATATNYNFTALPGVRYDVCGIAINSDMVESTNSVCAATYIRFDNPPQINVTGRTIATYNRTTDMWGTFKVNWTAINLAAYGASAYNLKVSAPGNADQYIGSTNNSYTFALLPVRDYTFSVSVSGQGGDSPAGISLIQSGKHPQNPTAVLINP